MSDALQREGAQAPSREKHEAGYWTGFQACCEGRPLETLASRAEQRGWWSALAAAADCETAGYLAGRSGQQS